MTGIRLLWSSVEDEARSGYTHIGSTPNFWVTSTSLAFCTGQMTRKASKPQKTPVPHVIVRDIVILSRILLFLMSIALILLGLFGIFVYSNILAAAEFVKSLPHFMQDTVGWLGVTFWRSILTSFVVIGFGSLGLWGATRIRVRRHYSKNARRWVLTIAVIMAVITGIALFLLVTVEGKIAEVKWIGTGLNYGKVTVELVPTDNAKADVGYAVELWEEGRVRSTALVRWSQPELNVHTSKWVNFPLTTEEFYAYRCSTEDLRNIFSVKLRKSRP